MLERIVDPLFSLSIISWPLASVSPLSFRSSPNLWPLKLWYRVPVDLVITESFPALFNFVSAYFVPLFLWVYSLFVSYRSFSLNRSCLRSFGSFCSYLRSFPTWAELLYILIQLCWLFTILVTFVILTDHLFRIRPYFPQWAPAHQVRFYSHRGWCLWEEYSGLVLAFSILFTHHCSSFPPFIHVVR